MTDRFCIATDLSPTSAAATELAFEWARHHRADVVLLHVVHDPELAPALGNDVPGDVQRAKQALEQLVSTKGTGLQVQIDVRAAEDVAGTIVQVATGASYLFVGSHGRSALQRLRLGSVATAVLRQSAVPVVCLPAEKA